MRNQYTFLASVAEDSQTQRNSVADLVTFLLIKKLFLLISQLHGSLKEKNNVYCLEQWSLYVCSREYKKVLEFI